MASWVSRSVYTRNLLFRALVNLVTLPYYRFFLKNTLEPAQRLTDLASTDLVKGSPEWRAVFSELNSWRDRKKDELGFISVACVAITAIISASFAWPAAADSYWLGPAAWYTALIWSLFGLLIAAQQSSLMRLIGDLGDDPNAVSAAKLHKKLCQFMVDVPTFADGDQAAATRTLSWKAIFVWQLPMMAMAYAFLMYFIGLTVVICTPLLQDQFSGDGFKTSVFYLVSLFIGLLLFVYCSLRGYTIIQLASEDNDDDEPVERNGGISAVTQSQDYAIPQKE